MELCRIIGARLEYKKKTCAARKCTWNCGAAVKESPLNLPSLMTSQTGSAAGISRNNEDVRTNAQKKGCHFLRP